MKRAEMDGLRGLEANGTEVKRSGFRQLKQSSSTENDISRPHTNIKCLRSQNHCSVRRKVGGGTLFLAMYDGVMSLQMQ